jgi:hypothetical protein
VNGKDPYSGNVFARNPLTQIYGPVCDDGWTKANVSYKFENIELVHPLAHWETGALFLKNIEGGVGESLAFVFSMNFVNQRGCQD